MACGVTHSSDVRAAASAALVAGESVMAVSSSLDVPQQTVSDWSRSRDLAAVRSKKAEEIDALLSGYLQEILVTLTAQARMMRDEEWLRKQKASELAIAHGVMCDKGFRILEAASRANSGPGSGSNV